MFSDGWSFGFLARHYITLCFPTNKSQRISTDYLERCLEFLQFKRRDCELGPGEELNRLYLFSSICNMDEMPISFEFSDGQTYTNDGSDTV